MTLAIDIKAAEQVYPNGSRALSPVDLKVDQGQFITLLGPSGCGKSTLLKMVAGLLSPSSGSISKPSSRLSFVFQEPALMPWATVEDNVRLPLDLAKVASLEAKDRVKHALGSVGLGHAGALKPHQLSGGMRMRVSIARGLVTQPRILLMDEPFGALDEITRHRLDTDLLSLWHEQGLTVMFVTHSISEAVYLSQRVMVMAAQPGRIMEEVRIDAPWPRGEAWRNHAQFHAHEQHLRQLLEGASRSSP